MIRNRNTQQRKWIRHVFETTDRPLTPQEVLDSAQNFIPGLGIATVYRNLKMLNEEEWLKAVELPGEPIRYERPGINPRHYFHCDSCRKVYNVPAEDRLESRLPEHFQVVRQEVLLYGQCGECSEVLEEAVV